MKIPTPQEMTSLNPADYDIVIVVFGSRDFDDRMLFHEKVMEYCSEFDKPILFVSGAAKSGADDLIIRWCRKFGYPCLPMPADWDRFNKAAGFIRNEDMAKISTHGLGFWDGKSTGTEDMRDRLDDHNRSYRIIDVTIDEEAKAARLKKIAAFKNKEREHAVCA